MCNPTAGKLMKVETGHGEFAELVKKIQMKDPKVGKVSKSVRFGQEECRNLVQETVLAGAAEVEKSSSALTTPMERSCLGRL